MEEEKKEKSQSKRKKKNAMTVLGGGFLVREKFTKQFPFMVYITILLMAISTNTYIAEERNRNVERPSGGIHPSEVGHHGSLQAIRVG